MRLRRTRRATVPRSGEESPLLRSLRFGLFCAMACSLNSILLSMLNIYWGQSELHK